MQSAQSRRDLERFAVLPRRPRVVALANQQFRRNLVQSCGSGSLPDQVSERPRTHVGVQAIGRVEDIGIARKGFLQGPDDIEDLVVSAAGGMQLGEDHPRLQAPVVVARVPEALGQRGEGFLRSSRSGLAQPHVQLDVGHRWTDFERPAESGGRLFVLALQVPGYAEIGMGPGKVRGGCDQLLESRLGFGVAMLGERLLGTLEARLNGIGRRCRWGLGVDGRKRQGACRRTECSPHRRNRKPSWPVAIIAQGHSTRPTGHTVARETRYAVEGTRGDVAGASIMRGSTLARAREGSAPRPKVHGTHTCRALAGHSNAALLFRQIISHIFAPGYLP